jgi:hypothetical protein
MVVVPHADLAKAPNIRLEVVTTAGIEDALPAIKLLDVKLRKLVRPAATRSVQSVTPGDTK